MCSIIRIQVRRERLRVNPVNNNPTQGSFGLVTAKDGNRTMQVSLQYVF